MAGDDSAWVYTRFKMNSRLQEKMMDKYEVAKTIGEEFNYPWIEEMNCFDGFPAKKTC